jgi:hypothetical protein
MALDGGGRGGGGVGRWNSDNLETCSVTIGAVDDFFALVVVTQPSCPPPVFTRHANEIRKAASLRLLSNSLLGDRCV